jgi:hypothetical protein
VLIKPSNHADLRIRTLRRQLRGLRGQIHPAPPADGQGIDQNCPACKKPVRKVFSTFNSPKKLSISDAKKAGFTVLKKVSKGEYERQ